MPMNVLCAIIVPPRPESSYCEDTFTLLCSSTPEARSYTLT